MSTCKFLSSSSHGPNTLKETRFRSPHCHPLFPTLYVSIAHNAFRVLSHVKRATQTSVGAAAEAAAALTAEVGNVVGAMVEEGAGTAQAEAEAEEVVADTAALSAGSSSRLSLFSVRVEETTWIMVAALEAEVEAAGGKEATGASGMATAVVISAAAAAATATVMMGAGDGRGKRCKMMAEAVGTVGTGARGQNRVESPGGVEAVGAGEGGGVAEEEEAGAAAAEAAAEGIRASHWRSLMSRWIATSTAT